MTPFARLEHALVWGDVGLDVYADEEAPRPGGCALNVAISLAQGGLPRVACAAPLGADGAPLREVLASRGVDVTHLELHPGATPRQPVRLAPSGERTLSGYQRGVLAGYAPGEAVRAAVREAGLVYVPVFDATLHLAELAWAERTHRERSATPVAVDLMDLADVDEAFAREAVRRSAVVFAGLDLERHGEPIERLAALAREPGAALVIVTLGSAGARAFAGSEVVSVAAAPVPGGRVIDTTGCGDAFAGAALAAFARGAAIREALAAGTTRGAEVAAHRGAVALREGLG